MKGPDEVHFVRYFASVMGACSWAESKANELASSGYRVVRNDIKPILLSKKVFSKSMLNPKVDSLEERTYGAVAIIVARRS